MHLVGFIIRIEIMFNFVIRYCKVVVQIVHKYVVVYLEFIN